MGGLYDLVGAEVGEVAALDVVPNSFRGIQIRRISQQPLNFEPVPLFEQEVFHDLAAMCRKVIPDQDNLGAFNETLQPSFGERVSVKPRHARRGGPSTPPGQVQSAAE